MNTSITSTHNKRIKDLLHLQEKSRNRKKEGRFIVEGLRETGLAIKGKFQLLAVYFCPDYMLENEFKKLPDFENSEAEIIEISKEVYQKLAYRSSTEGLIAVFASKENNLKMLNFNTENPLILVAEAPEKPGNIGAILRTADAANVDAVLIANPKTDLYNPNIIRSSVGCVFTRQIATGTSSEIIEFLQQKKIAIYSAILQDSDIYTEVDFTSASAIVVGTEDKGLEQEWREAATKNIIIPMGGAIDSMNVSVAAGILIFEAKRQRSFL